MARFTVATAEELAAHDDCAICLDSMLTACKLPCGHLSQLLSALVTGTGQLLSYTQHILGHQWGRSPGEEPATGRWCGGEHGPSGSCCRCRFFHFDGSLIASRLPSFLVGVIHTPNGERRPRDQRPA